MTDVEQDIHTPTPDSNPDQLLATTPIYTVLKQAAAVIESSHDPQTVIAELTRYTTELLKVDHIGVVVVSPSRKEGRVIEEFPALGLKGITVPIPEQFVELINRQRKPIAIDNINEASQYGLDPDLFKRQGIRSMAFIPMFANEEFIGAVGLDIYYEAHSFTAAELELASTISSQLGLVISQMISQDQIANSLKRMEFVASLGQQLTSTFDQDEIFATLRTTLPHAVETDAIMVGITSPTQPTVTLFFLDESAPTKMVVPIELSMVGEVSNTGMSQVFAALTSNAAHDQRALRDLGMSSAAAIPMILNGKVLGALIVASREPAHFRENDLLLLASIANQLGIALENARLFADASRRVEYERVLNQAGGASELRDLQSMLVTTMQQMSRSVGASRARIRLNPPPYRTGATAPLSPNNLPPAPAEE
jgi:GAF domain-containing protein